MSLLGTGNALLGYGIGSEMNNLEVVNFGYGIGSEMNNLEVVNFE
jgi:hypothetical protein